MCMDSKRSVWSTQVIVRSTQGRPLTGSTPADWLRGSAGAEAGLAGCPDSAAGADPGGESSAEPRVGNICIAPVGEPSAAPGSTVICCN